MPNQTVMSHLSRKKGSLFLSGLFVAALSFFALTVTEEHYKTTTDFLVVQLNAPNQDFYTQFKSAEYLGKVLAQSLYSERFIAAVVETGKVRKEFLPFDKQDRLNAWRKKVTVQSNAELGMLHVSLKSDNQKEAENLMEAIQTVLIEKNSLFRGGDDKSVEVRILSGPITERNPSTKEIAAVVAVGFLAGVLLMALISVMRSGVLRERETFGIPRDMLMESA